MECVNSYLTLLSVLQELFDGHDFGPESSRITLAQRQIIDSWKDFLQENFPEVWRYINSLGIGCFVAAVARDNHYEEGRPAPVSIFFSNNCGTFGYSLMTKDQKSFVSRGISNLIPPIPDITTGCDILHLRLYERYGVYTSPECELISNKQKCCAAQTTDVQGGKKIMKRGVGIYGPKKGYRFPNLSYKLKLGTTSYVVETNTLWYRKEERTTVWTTNPPFKEFCNAPIFVPSNQCSMINIPYIDPYRETQVISKLDTASWDLIKSILFERDKCECLFPNFVFEFFNSINSSYGVDEKTLLPRFQAIIKEVERMRGIHAAGPYIFRVKDLIDIESSRRGFNIIREINDAKMEHKRQFPDRSGIIISHGIWAFASHKNSVKFPIIGLSKEDAAAAEAAEEEAEAAPSAAAAAAAPSPAAAAAARAEAAEAAEEKEAEETSDIPSGHVLGLDGITAMPWYAISAID